MAHKPDTLVFSGDIGGTKIRLGLWQVSDGSLNLVEDFTIASVDVSGPVEAVTTACRGIDLKGLVACFGVAGPVHGGRSRLTNLPWVVDSESLERELGFERAVVINDLEATAWAVPSLQSSSLRQIKGGTADHDGAVGIIAAGTGLGQVGLIRSGEKLAVCSGEGGHADFAPQGLLEFELHQFLADRYGHVSWERVLSGPGLVDLAEFFFGRSDASIEGWLDSLGAADDQAAAVASAGLAGKPEACEAALSLFVELLGAQAANLALSLVATGGVYLAGGIPPKILPAILGGAFTERFLDKGRMRHLLEAIPVDVVLDQDAPLLGAACRAAGVNVQP
ncbi:MAG: glucokinase [Acidobacteriota bacterium]